MPEIEIEYQNALDYLYSFVDYSLTRQLRYSPEKFNLDRMRQMMGLLSDPHRKFPVIHIAGTKGKGSTAAMISGVLQASGFKVALYTSPHLTDFCERIKVDGSSISHQDFVSLLGRIREKIDAVKEITTFEVTTTMAFQHFFDQQVEIAVVEVGLGGRLDATNVVDPIVSVITSLSFDHMNILGDSISQIAAEKGGIIKEGKPVVAAPQWEAAREVIERICRERHAPLTLIGRDYFYRPLKHDLQKQSFQFWSAEEQELFSRYISSEEKTLHNWKPEELTVPLLGLHQVENAATARAVIEILRKSGWDIPQQAITIGFNSVFWPGRFEIIQQDPLILIDSAHNTDSSLRLRLALDDYLLDRPVTLIFGASEDKDISGMFKNLLPRVETVIMTSSTHPRALDPDKLVELAHQFGIDAKKSPTIEGALQLASDPLKKGNVILVTGSIFVAAAAREIILKNRR